MVTYKKKESYDYISIIILRCVSVICYYIIFCVLVTRYDIVV